MSTRLAKWTLIIVALLTVGAAIQIAQLRFDYEFEHFFPSEDEDLRFYYEFKEKFETDVDFVLLALHNEEGIFEPTFLKNAADLHDQLSDLRRVERIVSPFSANDFALGPFGPIAIPYVHPDDPAQHAADSTRIYTYQKGVGTLFSEDGKSLSYLILIEEGLSKVKTDTVFYDMMAVLNQYSFDEVHTAGKVVGQAYYVNQIKYEFTFFFSLAVLLIVLTLFLIYRSFWGVFVPLLVVLLSVLWLLGLTGLVNKPIDIMTTLLPLVLFVVGISDVIHLLSRYFEEIRHGHDKASAIRIAYRKVGAATFLTSLTTALGFLTLQTSGIEPVRELGVMAALGVFMAFLLAFTLLPAILTLTKVPALAYREPSSVFWNQLVRKIFLVSLRKRNWVVVASVLLVALSLWGINRVTIDNYLIEDIGEGDPHRVSFEFFEEHFSGVRPFELQVTVRDSAKTLFSPEVLEEMLRLEAYLKQDYEVGFMTSPLSIIRTANQALHGGLDSANVFPEDPADLKRATQLVSRFRKRPEYKAILANEDTEGRFTGKMQDVGGKRVKEKNDALIKEFTEVHPLQHIDIRLTGMSMLIDKNNETLSTNMMSGLLFAFLVVAVIMGVLFRSIPLAIISLIPNILPLLAVGGFMGLVGIDLKVSTSIIFGIAFGIAVDDSIHFMMKFRQEWSTGKPLLYALKRATLSTGKAIILTSLILCVGFITLVSSDFTSTYYVGLLISLTLAVAVLADLFLLPILLAGYFSWLKRWQKRR